MKFTLPDAPFVSPIPSIHMKRQQAQVERVRFATAHSVAHMLALGVHALVSVLPWPHAGLAAQY